MFQMRKFSLQKTAFIFTLLFVLFQNGFGQTVLEINNSIERRVSDKKEKHEFQLALGENQYAKILVEQAETDIRVQLFDADGNYLTRYEDEIRIKENEVVEFTSTKAGIYRIEIQAAYKKSSRFIQNSSGGNADGE